MALFYNGVRDRKDEVLNLWDAFRLEIQGNVIARRKTAGESLDKEAVSEEVETILREADPDINVKVRMININYGHNKELLSACKPLEEYSWFVAEVRKNLKLDEPKGQKETQDTQAVERAIDNAIDDMPADFEIREFLVSNRAEVKDMCLTEYSEAETMERMREDQIIDTRAEDIKSIMDSLKISIDDAMDALKIPQDMRLTEVH